MPFVKENDIASSLIIDTKNAIKSLRDKMDATIMRV